MLEAARGLEGLSAIARRNEAPAASRFSKRLTKALAKWTCSQPEASRHAKAIVSSSWDKVASRLMSSGVGMKKGADGAEERGTPPHPQRELRRSRLRGHQTLRLIMLPPSPHDGHTSSLARTADFAFPKGRGQHPLNEDRPKRPGSGKRVAVDDLSIWRCA